MGDHLIAEARRLRSIADDRRERYDSLQARHEASLDACFPGPSPAVLGAALNEWFAAEAAAETAAKIAKREAA